MLVPAFGQYESMFTKFAWGTLSMSVNSIGIGSGCFLFEHVDGFLFRTHPEIKRQDIGLPTRLYQYATFDESPFFP